MSLLESEDEQDVFRRTSGEISRYPQIMARGWESKSIEAQQELTLSRAQRPVRPPLSEDEIKTRDRRRTLELARSRTADDLARATAPSHREMLQQALAALDEQLQQLSSSGNAGI
jgi:hypothetical protein